VTLLDEAALRERVERLAALDRGSCSPGEREAAALLAEELESLGGSVTVGPERVHGTYWWPTAITSAVAALAGLRGGRSAGAAAAVAAAAAADDIRPGLRLLRRWLLPKRSTQNVSAEFGPPDAPHTVLFVAHYDAAHSGLVFHPELARWPLRKFPKLCENADTTPPTMWGAVAAPALAALAALVGSRALGRIGAVLGVGYLCAMLDIASRRVVPGANDNATGVAALLSVAHSFAADPPDGVRVIVLFPGSEESFMEGMSAYMRRHGEDLSAERTSVVCLDTVGSPELVLLEGEGMLRMRDYPPQFRALVASCADEAGVELLRGLRLRNATDGVIALRAGYPSAMLGSVDEFKIPTDYHWPTDTPDRVDYSTVADAARVCRRLIERLAATRQGAGAGTSNGFGSPRA
jgi:hypothetical protein